MLVTKRKGCGRFTMTCKLVKKFLLAMLVIHKRQHGHNNNGASGAEASYALYSEEIAENEANEALLTSLSGLEGAAINDAEGHQCQYQHEHPVQCISTVDGSFYWDESMQRLPVDGDFIEVHQNSSFRNLLTAPTSGSEQ